MKPPLVLRLPPIAPGESALVPGMAAPLPRAPGPALPAERRPERRFRQGMVRTHISGAQSRRAAAFLAPSPASMPDTSAGQPPTQQPSRWTYDLDPVTGASRANYPGAVAAPNLPGVGNTTGAGNLVLATGPTITSPTINSPTINTPTIAAPAILAPATIQGLTDGSNLAAGMIGEYRSANLTLASAVALSSGVNRDIMTLPLPAGDWDVWATISTNPAGGSPTALSAWLNTVSNSRPPDSANGASLWLQIIPPGSSSLISPIGRTRFNLAAPATVYLSAGAGFPGTCTAYGFIGARRMS